MRILTFVASLLLKVGCTAFFFYFIQRIHSLNGEHLTCSNFSKSPSRSYLTSEKAAITRLSLSLPSLSGSSSHRGRFCDFFMSVFASRWASRTIPEDEVLFVRLALRRYGLAPGKDTKFSFLWHGEHNWCSRFRQMTGCWFLVWLFFTVIVSC